jgi:hypothetical protein
MEYDIVIVGGGPSALALAQCCSFINKKVLIIEKESDIGGCHRVRRVLVENEKLFTEHGPRVYSSTYKVFISLLSKMNLDFYDLFVPYKFNITTIGKESIWSALSFKELFFLFLDFIKFLIIKNYGKDISMKDHLIYLEFSEKSLDMIDRICRLTDGAGSDNYTLYQFLQLLNQQFFYGLYQPKEPSDIGFLKKWKNYLEKNGVTFLLNTSVEKIEVTDNVITGIIAKIKERETFIKIIGDKYILAIPPKSIVSLLKNNELVKNAFGDFNNLEKWSEKTAYIDYITVSFHWDTKLNLPIIYGFPKSEWGLAFIVLTDYMVFNEKSSQTVISASVTIKENKSKRTGKRIDECNKDELMDEIFYQLLESFPLLPKPSITILSPGIINVNNQWKCIDTAFVATSKQPNLQFNSDQFYNLFNVGTHNGESLYNFTSLEASVTNAVKLGHLLYPELKREFYISSTITVKQIFWICIFIILISIISKKNIYIKNK